MCQSHRNNASGNWQSACGNDRNFNGATAALGDAPLRPDRIRCSTVRMRNSGRIYKLSLDGKVLGMFGESGKQLKQFGWIHEMACPSEDTLYVAELLNWRVQKVILQLAR